MRITQTHVYFWDGPFSQWYCKPDHSPLFSVGNLDFKTAEHYMMFHKADLFNDTDIATKILETNHPKDIKALGRLVKNFDKSIWDQHCDEIVKQGNLLKFSQNPDLLTLIKTHSDKTFVEASPYDSIWGVGLHESDDLILDESNWKGLNKLGKALIIVAQLLKDIKC